ncbi:MAG: CBS domain-containing protein [Candidatus Aenigmarchaeota archaeon]|nr:CBS domain-containing protein [Candidatus Aenigmarchaeota archaeon]
MVIITGEMIKKLRNDRGISQQDLAEAVGISQAHVAKIENEKVNPTLSTVNKIMSVLEKSEGIKCSQIMTRDIVSIESSARISEAIDLMKSFEISQIPVIEKGICLGCITEKTIIDNMDKNLNRMRVKDLMEKSCPIVSSDENIEMIKSILKYTQAVLVSENKKIVGILTKSDLLDIMD